ncbi:hypothetical protein D3870_10895 [Noviherbaspirillum cavernae]|uniref:Uncharacterized protein n=1 Tax=Noviherbaspirillum cavernae TaxID=2320862 RepID=A0A418X1W7_9BURK|nr:hypothetical protein [Noviherbaspirillum cavernae]RJG06452.1 hypothetical protein D3870_10895 [Noviherbaspirillum cavernae]
MKNPFLRYLLAFGVALAALPACADSKDFSFAVIAPSSKEDSDETVLREALNDTDELNLAFVVSNGIKAASEPCSDRIYNRRKSLLDGARNGLIVSLAASDWTECKNANGKSSAMERLNRLREIFFSDEFSMGGSRIPLLRQSTIAKFRSYGENARWEFGNAMFATVNLPGNNNHYSSEAGRNSEFEDRLVANKDWLQRVFNYASRRKLNGIVLFCDGDPLSKPVRPNGKRDGFAETRKQITALAAKFAGQVLIIHNQAIAAPHESAKILWTGNLGTLELGNSWLKFNVSPSSPSLFSLADDSAETKHGIQSPALR